MNQSINAMKNQFISLLSQFSPDRNYLENVWDDIYNHYSSGTRYYHNLNHIATTLDIIYRYSDQMENTEAILLAAWFHDAIHDTNKNNNEEMSVEFMIRALSRLKIPKEILNKSAAMILLTKTHSASVASDFDTKLFLDADLAILGTNSEEYIKYKNDVRKEYQQYSDIIYNAGRKKILEHLLEKEQIFQTKELRENLEVQARKNISSELKQLSI